MLGRLTIGVCCLFLVCLAGASQLPRAMTPDEAANMTPGSFTTTDSGHCCKNTSSPVNDCTPDGCSEWRSVCYYTGDSNIDVKKCKGSQGTDCVGTECPLGFATCVSP